ncbi:Isopenicillin N synthase [Halopseudomonas xinjiangensis]|uniref:Isopenicillin N synthase n=1 Tax=Halopseudomonas xinjiangensis TaxID=487184 RepID=A0A1H1SV23_9GAMM|nr:2-oxoglutarate and iron-dependent oxygenase domain-containing protein [Halopseudomonas xinjiangensis]SDS51887.1 Isopenicillin N synthase [Halopseudomonas xinjiangensis]
MASRQPGTSAHTAFTHLPVVDVSGLFSPERETREATARQLGKGAEEAGFLYITGHGVPLARIERLLNRTREYFAQPLDEKMRHYIGRSTNHSGYVPEGEEQFDSGTIDHKEAYDIGFDFLSEEGRRPMLGPNQWADLPGFREDIKAYYDAVLALSQQLFRGFALALGLPEDAFTKHVTTPPSQLRLIHYPFNPDAADRPGIGAHTDYECFTILLPTAPGLEVLNGAGEWIDVPLMKDAFVINIGDMLEVLSNGLFVATSHRVRKVAEERYSFPLFCACDYDTVIAPVPVLLSETNPARYEPIVCGEHLYAQTVQTFGYLKRRLEAGELALPDGAKALSSFGHQAAGKAVTA